MEFDEGHGGSVVKAKRSYKVTTDTRHRLPVEEMH